MKVNNKTIYYFEHWLNFVKSHFSECGTLEELKEHYIKNEKLTAEEIEIIKKY